MQQLKKHRGEIAAKIRELRQSRKWTQAELAQQLQLSQNRLSEIERGKGSFTAEQFLLLLKLFNVPLSHFVSEPAAPELRLQNALARLGAFHVQEHVHILPSEQLVEVHDVVREALVDGSPRVVTALAPVLVRNAERLNLARLYVELERFGLESRLPWVIDNTLAALARIASAGSQSKEWIKLDRRAATHLGHFLDHIGGRVRARERSAPLDVLDVTIRSRQTLDEVQRGASEISQRWGIITSLQVDDFLQALKAAHAAH